MTTVHMPNPLPPDLARKFTVQLYIAVGSSAVLLWDILLHIPQDYIMMTKRRLNISSVVYIIARLSGLAYVLGLVIVETTPISDCDYIRRVSFLYPVALPFTALLLVFRVIGLYMNKKYAIAFFSLSWLALLGNSIAVSMGVVGMQIGKTPYCVETKSQTYWQLLGVVGPVVHDTLIFLATTWAFIKNSYVEANMENSFRIVVLGKRLPPLSKSLLRDGQLYFLAAIIFNIVSLILFLVPQSLGTPCIYALPRFVLINTMSCHVYRNVRLVMYQDFTVVFPGGPSSSNQHQSGVVFSPRSRYRTHVSQEIDFEAARDDNSTFASREEVNVVGLEEIRRGA